MKDCRRSPPKQVTISILMKEEIVFSQKYTFFGIWIGSPGIADSDYFRLVQNRADSDSERKIGSSLMPVSNAQLISRWCIRTKPYSGQLPDQSLKTEIAYGSYAIENVCHYIHMCQVAGPT